MVDIYRFKSCADDDGILNLRVPLNAGTAEVEVVVIVHPLEPQPVQKPSPHGALPDYVWIAREKYPHAYEPWTEEEERRMMELFNAETDVALIAQILGRQPGAIESRVRKVLRRDQEEG